MKQASIISVGNEILAGRLVDTNCSYLSQKLLSVGIPVVSCYTIGDQIDSIVKTLQAACRDAEVILVTGGLGPTDDDLTRQAFAKFMGVELRLDEEVLSTMEDFFASRDVTMSENNKVQAYIPAGAKPLTNELGTAAGIIAEHQGKLLVAMPGVPSEMKRMFEKYVLVNFKEFAADQVLVIKRLKCFGAGESKIVEMLGDLMHRDRNPLINCTVSFGVITLHIVASADSRDKAEAMLAEDEKRLRDILGSLVFGTEDQSLAQVVGQKLTRSKKSLAIAESCTGGLISKLITDIPGSSQYFVQGRVTYSNESKIDLGVPNELIVKYGAVSAEVARALAESARSLSGTDFAIGVTGIAGPNGGSEEKPVGLVYIAVNSEEKSEVSRFIFSHDREFIRLRAAQSALNILRLELEI